ncbi:amidohydrolase family protein [Massilia rubra]|uniref:Amidohydrolase family protein n=1 Tax=Massilia rubra TaxID=2607910 RepID=A0ABX0LG00_9BURK|nr:amidohydrolase family protein [Massilia rubra]NHZ32934.1 amidohydrolase family protein [Massilia rubra]
MMPLARRVGAAAALLVLAGAAAAASSYSDADFYKVEKIDAHMHLHGDLPAFFARAQADKVRVLTINVDYPDFPPLGVQQDTAIALLRRHPSDVAFAATFPVATFEEPAWAATTMANLDRAIASGAVGVKVWKNIGMDLRDKDGKPVMVDDARFTPVFAHLAERGIVVLGHQAEPKNCWLPLDKMTVNSDRQYFREHPQYHMYTQSAWPGHAQQLAARDNLLKRHPTMRFLAVHLASLEWDVDALARFLDAHPDARVDLAARMAHFQQQAIKRRAKVRAFLIRYQDRVLYGTDLASSAGQGDADFAMAAHAAWLDDWAFLNSARVMRSPDLDKLFRGLALPKQVVDKLYSRNARKLFPQAWPSPGASLSTHASDRP